MKASHTLDGIRTTFDDEHLVANAGLLLPATLMQRLGLELLLRRKVDLGGVPGSANVGLKGVSLIAALLAGGKWIGDVTLLRAGETAEVLGHWVAAASTMGTFLRAFTWGHVRQLDAVSGELLSRAWRAGAGPGSKPLTIDVDSTICETYGLQKQGGSRFTYTKVRGYHPLLAVAAGLGDVLHARLRGGPAFTARGAAGFITETVTRVRTAGAIGLLTLRADSGFYNHKVVQTCAKLGMRFSITVRLSPKLHRLIALILDDAWTPIPYWLDGAADVAETSYTPFGTRGKPVRLVVRRVKPTPGSQLEFAGFHYTYHALITDRDGAMLELEADHRRHAVIENSIRDLKDGVALDHLPSGRFAANGAWLAFNVMAYNLARWVSRVALDDPVATTTTVRTRYLAVPGWLARHARQLHLHLPARWPWAKQFLNALELLRSLPAAAPTPA
ncbi:MAG: IS1380 family transposase [Steroidobacteraceae bacterium]